MTQADRATVLALLFAAVLAVVMSLALTQLSLATALSFGVVLAVVLAAVASNELALYVLIFAMLLGPQVMVGTLGHGTTLGRGLTLRLDDFLVMIVGLAWLAKSALYKELGLAFRTPLNGPIAAYGFAAVLATALGMLTGTVRGAGGFFFALKYIEYFVVYFMVVNNLRDRKQFQRFLIALLATAAVVSVNGMLQIPSGVRVSAPFEGEAGEPNTFGGYLVLMLALVAGLYLTGESARAKLGLATLGVLIMIPLGFTLSRAAYLALIPMVGALLLLSERRALLGAVVVLVLALSPLVAPRAIVDRVLYTVTQPAHREQVSVGGVRLDTSTSERLRSWSVAVLEDWPRRPVFGYGVTGYRFLDAQYPRVLAETGLAGLVTFLWLQTALMRRARAVLRSARDPLFKGTALGFVAGFAALIVHSIGANTFIIVRIMEPFWFLAGMVTMIPELEARRPPEDAAPRPPRARPRRLEPAAAPHPGGTG